MFRSSTTWTGVECGPASLPPLPSGAEAVGDVRAAGADDALLRLFPAPPDSAEAEELKELRRLYAATQHLDFDGKIKELEELRVQLAAKIKRLQDAGVTVDDNEDEEGDD